MPWGPEALPLALARLHGVVSGDVSLTVPCSVDDARPLFTAAGFEVTSLRRSGPGSGGLVRVRATRVPTLPDIVAPGMRLLICGLNPSLYSAAAGVNYARPGNRFWPAALAAGLVSRDRDPWHALAHHGIGFTDLVKRATVAAAELTDDEYGAGAERLAWTVRFLTPAAICFVGLTGWRAALDRKAVAGPQPGGFAGVPAYLMPNTSGLNAHLRPADFVAHLQAASRLAA